MIPFELLVLLDCIGLALVAIGIVYLIHRHHKRNKVHTWGWDPEEHYDPNAQGYCGHIGEDESEHSGGLYGDGGVDERDFGDR